MQIHRRATCPPHPSVPSDPQGFAGNNEASTKISRTELGGRLWVPLWRRYSLLFAANISSTASPQRLLSFTAFIFLQRSLLSRTFCILPLKRQSLCAEPESPAPARYCPAASGVGLRLPKPCTGGWACLCAVAPAAGPAVGWQSPLPS